MNEKTKRALQEYGIEIYNEGNKNAYIITMDPNIKEEIEYNIAKELHVNDNYMKYSIDLNVPCKDQFVMLYKVLDKIIDEEENIILILERHNIDLERK